MMRVGFIDLSNPWLLRLLVSFGLAAVSALYRYSRNVRAAATMLECRLDDKRKIRLNNLGPAAVTYVALYGGATQCVEIAGPEWLSANEHAEIDLTGYPDVHEGDLFVEFDDSSGRRWRKHAHSGRLTKVRRGPSKLHL